MVQKKIKQPKETSTLGCLNLVAAWVESLHRQGNISETLEYFRNLVRADAILFVRYEDLQTTPKILSEVSKNSNQVPYIPNCPPLSQIIFGQQLCAIRPATVWIKSDCDELSSTAEHTKFAELVSTHAVGDVVLIALATQSGTSDFLEFHFNTKVQNHDRDLIEILASTLAKSWVSRAPGTAMAMIKHLRKVGTNLNQERTRRAILDSENEVGLSRSEYRVCSLMKEGLVVRKIAATLAIKDSTVRSHLRSIYSKTETSGQIELLHRLAQN